MIIFVVYDNMNDRMLISKTLRVRGYDVLEVRNGVEAQLKKNSKTHIIPFVFYTATVEDMELGLLLGASRYFVKPLEPKEFFCDIEAALKEFKAGELKPRRPKITEEEFLDKYGQRISIL